MKEFILGLLFVPLFVIFSVVQVYLGAGTVRWAFGAFGSIILVALFIFCVIMYREFIQ